jgi:hypothetical protein
LGDSKVLSVKHPPGKAIPEFDQRSDNCSHVCSSLTGKKSRDVFEDEPLRFGFVGDPCDLIKEA